MVRHGGFLALGFAFALAAATAVVKGNEDAIRERHETMEGIGDAMKELRAIAQEKQPFDAAVVSEHAAAIAKRLETAAGLFGEGTQSPGSRALPVIWTDRGGFDQALKNARAAAVALGGVSDEAGFMPALGQLGAACRACHEKYRAPED